MHYIDGTPVQLGDMAKVKIYTPEVEVTGIVVGLQEQSDTCNIEVVYMMRQVCGGYVDGVWVADLSIILPLPVRQWATASESALVARMSEAGTMNPAPAPIQG